uniref:Uncharacterized protein n=1 Tax=Rhizophora mucronata TaxID=61149 RepID=A0A2P2QAG6_RHIMU
MTEKRDPVFKANAKTTQYSKGTKLGKIHAKCSTYKNGIGRPVHHITSLLVLTYSMVLSSSFSSI